MNNADTTIEGGTSPFFRFRNQISKVITGAPTRTKAASTIPLSSSHPTRK